MIEEGNECNNSVYENKEENNDGNEQELVSFRSIKEKTNRDLYGNKNIFDKSPKGSVDIPIKPLVDLINSHPSYATLSSCSGRITLFDPNGLNFCAKGDIDDDRKNDFSDVYSSSNNGKGKGGCWLLSSHAQITLDELEEALNHKSNSCDDDIQRTLAYSSKSILIFKHEPLLLHIAASNLSRARAILQVALTQCGLRESGMIYTQKRITVAFRSHALALSVPLQRPNHPLYPGKSFLKELVKEANLRFQLNERKISLLMKEMSNLLYPNGIPQPVPLTNSKMTTKCDNIKNEHLPGSGDAANIDSNVLEVQFHPFPSLRLWGHCTVSITLSKPSENHTFSNPYPPNSPDIDVIVIGGFGLGPHLNDTIEETCNENKKMNNKNLKCQRWNSFRKLSRKNDKWDKQWKSIKMINKTNISSDADDQTSQFSPREGHAACEVQLSAFLSIASFPCFTTYGDNYIVVIFGGRASPVKPNNQLFLYTHETIRSSSSSSSPNTIDHLEIPKIQGTIPEPRWGHTLTALSINSVKKGGHLAVLLGGRNENVSFSSMFILSVIENDMSRAMSTKTDEHKVKRIQLHDIIASSFVFMWSRVEVNIPYFYHSTLLVDKNYIHDDNDYDETIFIFGGLSNPSNLLEVFHEPDMVGMGVKMSTESIKMNISFNYRKTSESKNSPSVNIVPFDWNGVHDKGNLNFFASTFSYASQVSSKKKHSSKTGQAEHIFVRFGGIRMANDTARCETKQNPSIQILTVLESTSNNESNCASKNLSSADHIDDLALYHLSQSKEFDLADKDLSLMVHHTSTLIPGKPRQQPAIMHDNERAKKDKRMEDVLMNYEMLVLGGGISAFAFGPVFSR